MVVITEEAISMIRRGISLNKINKATGLGKSTLYFHYKKLKGKKTIPIKFNFSNETEIGEFMGIFAGDGSFYKQIKTSHYVIRVYVGYYELNYAEYLRDTFSKWFTKKPAIYFTYYRGNRSAVIIQYYSKDIYLLIKKYLEWSGIKTYSIGLKNLDIKKHNFNIGFLRGLIDTDGNFYAPKRRISFSSTSKKLSDQAYSIMKEIGGVTPNLNIIKKEGRHDLYTLALHGKNAKRLIKIIQPRNINKDYAALI